MLTFKILILSKSICNFTYLDEITLTDSVKFVVLLPVRIFSDR